MKKLTEEQVRERLKIANPGIEMLGSYVSVNTKNTFRCEKGHIWQTLVASVVCQKTKCPICQSRKTPFTAVKARLAEKRPNLEIIDEQEYVNANTPLKIKCRVCNYVRKTSFNNLMHSRVGCPYCGRKNRLTLTQVKAEVAQIHPFIKILSTSYHSIHKKLKCECLVCNKVWAPSTGNLLRIKSGCPVCAKKESKIEIKFLNSFKGWHKDRSILNGKELDAYFKDAKLAIEVNGCFWHSDKHTRIHKNYHLEKTEKCEAQGIKLLQFWDFELKEKFNSCVKIVNAYLTKFQTDFSAQEISMKEAKAFINENDLNAFKMSDLYFGLFDDKLVGVLALRHIGCKEYEITNFCSPNLKTLYDYFVKNYEISKVHWRLNRRFFSHNDALSLGFRLQRIEKPSYFYYNQEKRFSKYSTKAKNFAKVYDCGYLRYAQIF